MMLGSGRLGLRCRPLPTSAALQGGAPRWCRGRRMRVCLARVAGAGRGGGLRLWGLVSAAVIAAAAERRRGAVRRAVAQGSSFGRVSALRCVEQVAVGDVF